MTYQNRDKIVKTLEKGTLKEKSFVLEEIWEARDVSLVSSLVDTLEKEKSPLVKKRILLLLLDRLIPLSELKDIDIGIDIARMLRSSDPFIRHCIVEIISRMEVPVNSWMDKTKGGF